MKKIILVALAAIVSTGAFAQKFEWGVKAGLNLAKITDSGDEAKMRTGLAAGVFGEYVINDLFGIQAELLYSMQGLMFKESEGDITIKDVLKGDYINLPILAKFYVLEGLSVDVGPQFGYMVSLKNTLSGIPAEFEDEDEGMVNGTTDLYKEDGVKKFDISVGMGLTYKLNFGLDVFARYNLGLTKVSEGDKSKNSVIQVGVGYRF